MRLLLVLLPLLSFPAFAGETVLENEYVRVTRDAAPCATAGPACADRIIVALGDLELSSGGARRTLVRGDIAIFKPDQSFTPPDAGSYLEVSIKAGHPPARSPGEIIAPEKNAMRHDSADFFVFEEKLEPGDTRARHSHSQRVVIQLNRARLQQWPDGEPAKFVDTVPDRPVFSPPVIHKVSNVGDIALRGIIVEFKPR
jgi:hypothetical protein